MKYFINKGKRDIEEKQTNREKVRDLIIKILVVITLLLIVFNYICYSLEEAKNDSQSISKVTLYQDPNINHKK